jgi:hypothetical protein
MRHSGSIPGTTPGSMHLHHSRTDVSHRTWQPPPCQPPSVEQACWQQTDLPAKKARTASGSMRHRHTWGRPALRMQPGPTNACTHTDTHAHTHSQTRTITWHGSCGEQEAEPLCTCSSSSWTWAQPPMFAGLGHPVLHPRWCVNAPFPSSPTDRACEHTPPLQSIACPAARPAPDPAERMPKQ